MRLNLPYVTIKFQRSNSGLTCTFTFKIFERYEIGFDQLLNYSPKSKTLFNVMTWCPLMEGTREVGPIPSWQFLRHSRRWSGLNKVLLKQTGKQLWGIGCWRACNRGDCRYCCWHCWKCGWKPGFLTVLIMGLTTATEWEDRYCCWSSTFTSGSSKNQDIIFNQLLNFFLQRIALLSVMTWCPLMEGTVLVRTIPRW